MEIPLWQVDAFANRPFTGNPAAVCPLEQWLPDAVMQAIAAENNVSETAFFVRRPDADYDLRWFTPTIEVDLCGHATLASAWVLLSEMEPSRGRIAFHTKSGPLTVARAGAARSKRADPNENEGAARSKRADPNENDADLLAMDLPARPAQLSEAPDALVRALRSERSPASVLSSVADPSLGSGLPGNLVAVFDRAEDVRALVPDMADIVALDGVSGVGVTAPGTGADADVDFVSRYFAPAKGIPEDPVTGGLHTTLVPYWAKRLDKGSLRARQVSARGGELGCRLEGNRVILTGHAVIVVRGTMRLA
jgi:predicted PhzF superfamily epimerase YddE/YHI9